MQQLQFFVGKGVGMVWLERGRGEGGGVRAADVDAEFCVCKMIVRFEVEWFTLIMKCPRLGLTRESALWGAIFIIIIIIYYYYYYYLLLLLVLLLLIVNKPR